ncbi:MAG TPA: SIMPL domain-containing protein [Wenzhouxiangella sp.]|nr:SIMPL domain-containing protein [Wenzhouxiangella sp.]
MSNHLRSGSLILGICLVVGLTLLGYVAGNAALSVKAMERTVTVKGLSEREVTANIAAWPLTFQVASNDLDEVYQTIEDKSAIIRDFLKRYGISDEEIIPSPPNVTDVYAQQWGDQSSVKFRYSGSGTVTVHSEQVEAVREAMANVLELGKRGVVVAGDQYAGQRSGMFLYTRLNDIKPEMVEEATKKARSVAEKFAEDSNSRLGKIKRARQGQFSINDRDSTTPHIKKVRVVSTIEYYLSD